MKKLLVLGASLLLMSFSPFALAAETPPAEEQPKDFGNYLPAEVPNIFDPEVRSQFQRVGVVNLRGNPDFPVLIFQNIVGGQPQTILLGLDARNGKEGWSLRSDSVILVILFADPETILAAYVDAGFADSGKPSRVFRKLDDPLNLKGLGKGISLIFM